MTITSSISNNFSSQTSTLLIQSGATTIENVVYTLPTNTVLFNAISSFALSATDFISFAGFKQSFRAAILASFSPALYASPTFSCYQMSDINDGTSQLSYSYYHTVHPIFNITATYPSGTVNFGNRNLTTTMSFDEYVYYLNSFLHFTDEIHRSYKI